MINEITPRIFNSAWNMHREYNDSDVAVLFRDGEVLLEYDGKGIYTLPDMSLLGKEIKNFTYLFSIDDKAYYTAFDCEKLHIEQTSLMWKPISYYREAKRETGFVIITALGLYRWYCNNRFCGKCGCRNIHSKTERALVCEKCGNTIYPIISPAVTVAVINDNKLLLAKSAQGSFKKYALIAGYTEIGETFDETVKREVMEEVGLKVKDITYYKNQPWGLSGAQMVGFFARLSGSDEITLDTNELSEAKWFTPDEIDWELDEVSLTYEMIRVFKEGRVNVWRED